MGNCDEIKLGSTVSEGQQEGHMPGTEESRGMREEISEAAGDKLHEAWGMNKMISAPECKKITRKEVKQQ